MRARNNLVYEVNDELIIRRSKADDPAHRSEVVRREADLLAGVAGVSTLPVPRRQDAERTFQPVAEWLPAPDRRLLEDFLGRAPPAKSQALALCHNDLGSEHILVDVESNAVTGIIDWAVVAIADPGLHAQKTRYITWRPTRPRVGCARAPGTVPTTLKPCRL